MGKNGFHTVTKIMAIALAIGTFCGMFLTMAAMTDRSGNMLQDVVLIVRVLVALFATYYLAVGFSKEKGAELFKAYLWCYAAFCLLQLLNRQVRTNAAAVCFCGLQAAALCVPAAVKNLGACRSKLLAGLVTVLAVAQTVLQICLAEKVTAQSGVGYGMDILLGLSVFVLVLAKYADKKARGREV